MKYFEATACTPYCGEELTGFYMAESEDSLRESGKLDELMNLCEEKYIGETDRLTMEDAAAAIGSDDPFFVRCTPRICAGRGEVLIDNDLDLSGKWIAILKPPYGISTAQAYGGVTPAYSTPIEEITALPISEWRGLLKNDFEQSAFALHPELAEIKEELYLCGAEYAAMSGSGSAIFGLFEQEEDAKKMRTTTPYIFKV